MSNCAINAGADSDLSRIAVAAREVLQLFLGDNSETITLHRPDGLKFVLPGTKAAR